MKSYHLLLFSLLLISAAGCGKLSDNCKACDDCEAQSVHEIDYVCPQVYDPVCGCDCVTYPNQCEAEVRGITEWTEGACE